MNKLFVVCLFILFVTGCRKGGGTNYSSGNNLNTSWDAQAEHFIDSVCTDPEKQAFMKKYYSLLSATKKRDYVMSNVQGLISKGKGDLIILEEFSQDNNYLIIYLREYQNAEVVKFRFGLSDESIRRDTIPIVEAPRGENIVQEIRAKGTCCWYLLGSHNPILSVFSHIGYNENRMYIKDVVVSVE